MAVKHPWHAEYYKANREKHNKYGAKYYALNRDRLRKCNGEWRKTNRHRCNALYVAYKARKRKATIGDLTDIAKVYERAQTLRRWFDVAVDHVVPLAKGGTHEASNLQIIYKFENCRKHTKINLQTEGDFHLKP